MEGEGGRRSCGGRRVLHFPTYEELRWRQLTTLDYTTRLQNDERSRNWVGTKLARAQGQLIICVARWVPLVEYSSPPRPPRLPSPEKNGAAEVLWWRSQFQSLLYHLYYTVLSVYYIIKTKPFQAPPPKKNNSPKPVLTQSVVARRTQQVSEVVLLRAKNRSSIRPTRELPSHFAYFMKEMILTRLSDSFQNLVEQGCFLLLAAAAESWCATDGVRLYSHRSLPLGLEVVEGELEANGRVSLVSELPALFIALRRVPNTRDRSTKRCGGWTFRLGFVQKRCGGGWGIMHEKNVAVFIHVSEFDFLLIMVSECDSLWIMMVPTLFFCEYQDE